MKRIELTTHPKMRGEHVKRYELHIRHKNGGNTLYFPSDEDGNIAEDKLTGHQLENLATFKRELEQYAEPELIIRHVNANVQAAYNRPYSVTA